MYNISITWELEGLDDNIAEATRIAKSIETTIRFSWKHFLSNDASTVYFALKNIKVERDERYIYE